MGSSASVMKSSKLSKPDDCSQENWKQILQLFDKLDSDGTQSIEDGELMGNIAILHVDNNIKRLNDNKRALDNKVEFEKEKIRSDLEINIKKLRKEAEDSVQILTDDHNQIVTRTDASIKSLNEMTLEEKSQKIRKTICGNKDCIEFWDFYQYMKIRTNDIPNIIW